MKKYMLQNDLQEHKVFINSSHREKDNIAQGNRPLDFDAHTDLAQKHAAQMDGPNPSMHRQFSLCVDYVG